MGNQIPDYDPDLGNNHDHPPIPVDNLSKIFRIGYAYQIILKDDHAGFYPMLILREIVSDIFPTLLCFEFWAHDIDNKGMFLPEYHFDRYLIIPVTSIQVIDLKDQNEIRFLKLATLK